MAQLASTRSFDSEVRSFELTTPSRRARSHGGPLFTSWVLTQPSDLLVQTSRADFASQFGLFDLWHTGAEVFVMHSAFLTSRIQEPAQLNATDLCRERLSRVIHAYEAFPASYNQMLVQGAADYCNRVLARLDEGQSAHRELLAQIRKFATQLEALYRQYVTDEASSFALLDLHLVEDRFELIQARSADSGILAPLRELPISRLLRG